MSGMREHYRAWDFAKRCSHRGKMGIEVGINLDLHFMVVIRRPLEETPPTDVYIEEDVKFMEYLGSTDGLRDYIALGPDPPPTLTQRIRSNTIGRVRRFVFEWF
jgi:hypothetical protein